jgi:hypothetical protein
MPRCSPDTGSAVAAANPWSLISILPILPHPVRGGRQIVALPQAEALAAKAIASQSAPSPTSGTTKQIAINVLINALLGQSSLMAFCFCWS